MDPHMLYECSEHASNRWDEVPVLDPPPPPLKEKDQGHAQTTRVEGHVLVGQGYVPRACQRSCRMASSDMFSSSDWRSLPSSD